MPRLTRKNIKVFAGSATNNGVFGSLQANNPTTTSDVEQLQSLSAWSEGWNAATETSEELPPLEEIQGVEYVTTYQQAYIMQEGIPEWAATVTYYKGCLTKEVTSTGFKIYNSLTDNNTGNLLSDTSNWKKVMDSDDVYAFDNTVVHKTGNETIAGVKTFSSSPIIPTATTGDSSTKAANTAFVTGVETSLQTQINTKATPTDISNAVSNLLATLYPVGAIYIGTQNSCPLATLISGSTWNKIGTSITTDVTIPSSIAVYGNGKTLGLTLNNSSNYGLSFGTNNSWGLRLNTGFGSNINSSVSETSTTVNKALGITNKTNGDSGIVAKSDSITKTSITVNIWQRTA